MNSIFLPGIKSVLDMGTITDQSGNPIYMLPVETSIYNGSSSAGMVGDEPTFFAFSEGAAKQYGNVTEYKTINEFKLIALMELTKKNKLYTDAPTDMQKKIVSAFSIGKPFEEKERISDGGQDRAIMEYICTQGYDGYAMNGHYKGDIHVGEYFHPEMVLCHPTDDNIKLEHTFEIKLIAPRPERKKRPIVPHPVSPISTSHQPLYGSSSSNATPISTPPSTPPSTHPSTPPRPSLFGFNNTPPSTPPRKRSSPNRNGWGGKGRTVKRRKTKKNKKNKNKKQTKRVKRRTGK